MNAPLHNDDIQVGPPADRGVREVTLLNALTIVLESRWLIAGIVFIATLGGICHVLIAPPVYRADALLHIDRDAFGIGALGDFSDSSGLFYGLETSAEAKVLRSRSVLGPVVDKLNLDIAARPARLPVVGAAIARIHTSDDRVADPWIDLENSWLDLDKYGWGGETIEVQRFDPPEASFGKPFTIVAGVDGRYQLFGFGRQWLMEGKVGKFEKIPLPGDERLSLLVSVLYARPGTHFEITREARLNAIKNLNESFTIEMHVEDTGAGEPVSSGLLELGLDGLDPTKISTALKEIVNTYVSLNARRKYYQADKMLALLEQELNKVKKQMIKTEAALNDYRFEHGSVDLEMETGVILDKIVRVETGLSELKTRRTDLLQKFTPEHNRMAVLDTQIATLNAELASLENEVKTLPQTEQEILSLSREAEVDRYFYTLLSNKVQELKVVKAGTVGSANVLDPVAIPVEPVKPRKSLVISIYVMLGGVFGVTAAFARKTLRGVVEDPDEIEKQLGLPIYAVVPHSPQQKRCAKGDGRKGVKRTVLAARDPQDVAIESLRSLRTWMNFALLNARNNMLLVTGPGPGVGKSFVSVNLGTVWAGAGKRVLVIDADLRKGHLHRYFALEREGGLSDCIAGGIDINQAIRQTKIESLSIITAGAIPPNPSELLMHERFAFILEDISSRFDHVLIDSPPILAVTDAAILGRLAAAALLVIKANTHSMREIEQSVQRLRQGGVPLRGVVFNDMDISKRYGYGNYYGQAYYSYK